MRVARNLSHAERKNGRRYDEVAAEATGQSARSCGVTKPAAKPSVRTCSPRSSGRNWIRAPNSMRSPSFQYAERESLVARAAAGELFGHRQAASKASGARCGVGSPCGGR